MKKLIASAIICAVVSLSSQTLAQDISDRMSASDIETLLSDAGLNPDVISDKDTGAPVAMGKLGQVNFIVRALECDGEPISCEQLLFFANFDLNRAPTDEDYRIVNDFNDSNFDGRAYVLEESNQIGVDFYIDLTGGVTTDHVASRLSRWKGVISSFLEEMRAARTGS